MHKRRVNCALWSFAALIVHRTPIHYRSCFKSREKENSHNGCFLFQFRTRITSVKNKRSKWNIKLNLDLCCFVYPVVIRVKIRSCLQRRRRFLPFYKEGIPAVERNNIHQGRLHQTQNKRESRCMS